MQDEQKVENIVDTIGLFCPEPVFRLRKALDKVKVGGRIKLLTDDPAAEEDVKRLLSRRGDRIVDYEIEGTVLKFTIMKVK
ncbi:MAG: sulfurtransferase TusA family protein [Nitrososphaeria archaeon]